MNRLIPGHGLTPTLNLHLRPETRSLYVDDTSNYLEEKHIRHKRGNFQRERQFGNNIGGKQPVEHDPLFSDYIFSFNIFVLISSKSMYNSILISGVLVSKSLAVEQKVVVSKL